VRRAGVIIVAVVAVALTATAQGLAGSSSASGGGRGTVDGVTPFSQFGFAVHFGATGAASGRFNCLMAGASAFPGFEPLMKVSGSVTGGTLNAAAGTASFTGSGTLNLGPSGRMPAVFQVSIRAGGPGVGKLHLTVLVPFFPVPEETVLNGQITIH
jgi:hypothetical protein